MECRILFVVMLNVIMLNVIMLSVVAPPKITQRSKLTCLSIPNTFFEGKARSLLRRSIKVCSTWVESNLAGKF
jgi:hypothetical protein